MPFQSEDITIELALGRNSLYCYSTDFEQVFAFWKTLGMKSCTTTQLAKTCSKRAK